MGLSTLQNLDPLTVPQHFDLKAVDRIGMDGLVRPVFAAGKDRLQNNGDHVQKLATAEPGAANCPDRQVPQKVWNVSVKASGAGSA